MAAVCRKRCALCRAGSFGSVPNATSGVCHMVIQLNLFSGTNLIRERGCLDWSDAGRLAPNPHAD